MNRSVRLEPIVPYNDVFYKGCFFNSLFSMLPYYGVDELSIVCNDIIQYQGNIDGNGLNVVYKELRKLDKILLEQGIRMTGYGRVDVGRLGDQVKAALSGGRPVIVWVDSYYLPERKDTYLKMHWAHSLLIIGFDEARNVCYMVEHTDRESLTYAHREISFGDLQDAYNGFIKEWPHVQDPIYLEFQSVTPAIVNSEEMVVSIGKHFARHLAHDHEWFAQSQHELRGFRMKFSEIVTREEEIKAVAGRLLECMSSIINAKKVEKLRIHKLYSQDTGLLEYADAIVSEWNKVRTAVGKFFFSGVYHRTSLLGAVTSLERIEELEEAVYKCWVRIFLK